VLHWQGRNDDVLALLTSEPGPPLSGELAVKRQRLEGAAYISLHRFSEGEKSLREAEQVCKISPYPSCNDVVSSRGILDMERGNYSRAQIIFGQVLISARSNGDKFLEANTLLDLSWSADEQTHFDEALDWANASRQMAIPLGFSDLAQTALGNMGWAYYKLGDPEKAEGMFLEARDKALKLGNVTDGIRWLLDVGYLYFDSRKLTAAEQSFRQSLDLAQKLKR